VRVGQGLPAAERRRQCRGEDLAQGNVAVARQPGERVAQLAREQRRRVQQRPALALYSLASVAVYLFGLWAFATLKKGFADVL
jgi:hypothetical protein